jgi:phosphoserine aminotransferase
MLALMFAMFCYIVRKALLGRPREECPITMDYTVQAKAKSAYNTPNVWGVYIFNLVLKWVLKQGGVEGMFPRGGSWFCQFPYHIPIPHSHA